MSTTLTTGTDFVTVARKDFDSAAEFYGNVLGLPLSKRLGADAGGRVRDGTLTIAVMQSDAFGFEFPPATTRSRSESTTSRRPGPSSSPAA